MEAETRPATWRLVLAFGIIYFVWGSTFYAIRVGVHEVPPLLLAAMRFFTAGFVLFAWALVRGERLPNARQWRSVALLAFMIFVLDYGLLFWAEKRVPSGMAAVMLATIPAFMALAEIVFLRSQRLTARLAFALLVGFGGVAVLVNPAFAFGGAPIDWAGAVALVIAAVSWSTAAAFSRKLVLPGSKAMSAGAQMLAGGVFLAIAAASLGEVRDFRPSAVSADAWFALAYLIVAGSIVGFTAYVWLIHHQSPTRVGTYAYVNPVVAVLIGYFLGGEPLNARTILGTIFVLASVIVIVTMRARKAAPALPPDAE